MNRPSQTKAPATGKHKQLKSNISKIYLAGPEVFLREAAEMGVRKKDLCKQYGFCGVYPIDVEVDVHTLPKHQAGIQIGQLNETLIRSCDALIANMTPFRGPSADLGTAYEMGYARALGMVVFGYTNRSEPFMERTLQWLGNNVRRESNSRFIDSNDMYLEDWTLADNLMLESGIVSSGGELVVKAVPDAEIFTNLMGFEACLQKLSLRVHASTF